MRKPRAWDKMDHAEKLEALTDLDTIYDRVDAHERTMRQHADHVDRVFTRLAAEIYELKQVLARK
jgi:ribosome assembly protein YihI (activator of Der GTPase)